MRKLFSNGIEDVHQLGWRFRVHGPTACRTIVQTTTLLAVVLLAVASSFKLLVQLIGTLGANGMETLALEAEDMCAKSGSIIG